MTRNEAIAELVRIWHSPHLDLSLKAGLGEAIDALKGEDGDLISRRDAIDACCRGWNNTAEDCIRNINALPSSEPKTDEESELRFYYVESIDDYWIGQRLDNFYYADWHEGLGFVWSKSRYLPWGEHIVNENTLWKEHTYPSEPIEIPFTEWIVGFVKKYFAEPKTGEWIPVKWHEITDEEREREGYPKDWVVCIDCEMPSDEQEILVQTKSGYVRWDVCYEEGEYSLDSGWDWIEDIVAWMPLPEPYKGGEEE